MADPKLYHLMIEWEPGYQDDWFPYLFDGQVALLKDRLGAAERDGIINEWTLGHIKETSFQGLIEDWSKTELRLYLGSKDWSPEQHRKRK